MATEDEAENKSIDPIWTTWRYGHDLAFGAAAMMAEKMAEGMEAEPEADRGDPAKVLRAFAGILRMGKYSDKERPHAMLPIDEAVNLMLDDPRVLGALADRMGRDAASFALECLKGILLPPTDDTDE